MANDTSGAPAGVTFDFGSKSDAPQPQSAPEQTQTPGAPQGVTFDFNKVAPTTQPGAPKGVSFDFNKAKPLPEEVPAYAQGASQATGLRGPDTGPTSALDKALHLPNPTQVANWADAAKADVRNGTSSTWVGWILNHVPGVDFKGTAYGVSPGASQIGGAVPEGALTVLHGVTQAGTHPVRAANEIVSGVGQALGPAMVTQPEALPFIAGAMAASHSASAVATHMGADPDTAELIGNVAGLIAGGKTVRAGDTAAFESAVNKHMSANEVYNARLREIETATQQANQAQRAAQDATAAEANGTGTKEQRVAAQNAASVASKNATTAQEALKVAEENRKATAIEMTKSNAQILREAKGKSVKTAKPEDIEKAYTDFEKGIPAGPGKSA